MEMFAPLPRDRKSARGFFDLADRKLPFQHSFNITREQVFVNELIVFFGMKSAQLKKAAYFEVIERGQPFKKAVFAIACKLMRVISFRNMNSATVDIIIDTIPLFGCLLFAITQRSFYIKGIKARNCLLGNRGVLPRTFVT